MKREASPVRPLLAQEFAEIGFRGAFDDGAPYWDESVRYVFRLDQIEDDIEKAAEELHAALRLNPRSVIATNNLAAALGDASHKEAVERLESVADPATAHNNMAAVLIDEGRYPEARKEIEIALSYNRQHSAALSNLALVSQRDGQPAEVRAVKDTGRGPWARTVRTWRRFLGDSSGDGKTLSSGTTTASR